MSEPTTPPAITPPGWQRPFLPAGLLAEPGQHRSLRDWVVDLIAFGFAALIGALALVASWKHQSDVVRVLDIVLGVVSLGLLWIRRTHPIGVAVFVLTAAIFSGAAAGAAVVAALNAAIRVPTRRLLPICVLMLGSVVIYPLWYPSEESYVTELIIGGLLVIVVVGWGLFARVQRDYVAALHERAARIEAEQRLHLEAARESERRRIAGEMHDVLAHRVSLLSVHAGALEFRPDAPPEEIAAAAGVIRASARAALEELRAVVGVLRDDQPAGEPEPPQPTLAAIPALLEESRAARMRVRWTSDVPADAHVPDALGRTAYRVVQEGLTNARRHAPGAAVDVAVRSGEDDVLTVRIASRPPVSVPAADVLPGTGTGLIGLSERVSLAGGTLEHGPDPSGDFVLRAVLPWPA